LGSSFLPSDILAAFLYAQLESLSDIQQRRKEIWDQYHQSLQSLAQAGKLLLPQMPAYASNNAHMYYIVCASLEERGQLIDALKSAGIMAVFHYLSLHKSPYYQGKHDGRVLPNTDYYSDCLLRLPMFYELSEEEQHRITEVILNFYAN